MNTKYVGLFYSVLFVLMFTAGSLRAGENLIPDTAFQKADFTLLAKETTWLSYVISKPSKTVLNKDKKSVTMTGGKTFLHSSRFKVIPGKKYFYSLKIKGKGKISVESLWWTKDGDMASPHRTFSIKEVSVNNEEKVITGEDTASKNAAEAYIRIVVEDGTVAVSSPVVSEK